MVLLDLISRQSGFNYNDVSIIFPRSFLVARFILKNVTRAGRQDDNTKVSGLLVIDLVRHRHTLQGYIKKWSFPFCLTNAKAQGEHHNTNKEQQPLGDWLRSFL